MKLFSKRLLIWYRKNGRDLPWRGRLDHTLEQFDHVSRSSTRPSAYAVWVSEIMLQQTQVATVIPYFKRWMIRFPTISTLATASEQEVLSAWEGLGYYGRARNLYCAARMIIEEFGGELTGDVNSLRHLPGIGRYTAGAIASLAFGLDEPALDGNIRRVLARVFNVDEFADSAAGEKALWALATEYLPKGQAGDYNQALMDLGATICKRRNPTCSVCPARRMCQARAMGIQEQRPKLKPKPVGPHHIVTAAIIQRKGRVLLAKRPAQGLLGGMWEFPGGKVENGEDLQTALRREISEELDTSICVGEPFGIYRHTFTHFSFTLHAFLCQLQDGNPRPVKENEICWVKLAELPDYPMGKVDRQIARRLTM